MTKKELAYQVVHTLSGGNITDTAEKYDERYIMQLSDLAVPFLVKMGYYQERKRDSYTIPPEFVKSYKDVPIKVDVDRDIYYSELPGVIISILSDKGVKIYPMQDMNSPFIQVKEGAAGAWGNLEAFTTMQADEQLFWIEGKRAYYKDLKYYYINKTVLISMTASVSGQSDSDQLAIPEDMEFDLVKLVVDWYSGKRTIPEDAVNDNRPVPAM